MSLTDATKILPARRQGKRPHVSTLYRWALHGCRGIKLETIQVGATLCTSREALERFFAKLAAVRANPESADPQVPAYRERQIAEASRQAEALLR